MRNWSELLSSIGTCFEIVKAIINAVLDQGGEDSDVRRILKDKELRKEIARVILAIKMSVCTVVKAVCDYSLTLPKMKGFDWTDEKSSSVKFPAEGKSKKEVVIELLLFNRRLTPGNAITRMKNQGYRPATLAELYALAESLPQESFCETVRKLRRAADEAEDQSVGDRGVYIAGLGSVVSSTSTSYHIFPMLILCLGDEGEKRYGLQGSKDDKRHEFLASVFYAAVRMKTS